MIQCVDVLEGFDHLDDNCVDVAIIDPPYNIGKDFGNNIDKKSLPEYKEWCAKWVSECERVLKESGTLYIYGFPEILCHLAVDIPYPLEYKFLVWSYKNKAVPRLTWWQRSHESILCCWKSDNRIFNLDDVRVPYTDVFLKNAAGKVRKGTKGRYSHSGKETIYEANPGGALPRDVIEIPSLAGGSGVERFFLCKTCDDVFWNKELKDHSEHDIIQHPTQKPYELTRRLLLAAKPKENGHVVIPFVGTGSECAVVEDLGMSYTGFEINPDYVKMAEKFLIKRKNATN